jgi:hypothetical protein
MSEHTKEPWIITGSNRIKYIEARIGDGMLQEIASCMMVEHGNHEDNARRIVACVNALEGIPTELLERALKASVPVARPVVLINRESNQILDKEALK